MSEPIAEFYGNTDELISTTEILYLIGDDNCQFNTIVRILEPEKSINIDRKLIDIAIDLNIPGGTIAHWRRGINFGNLSNDVLLYELLKEFRSKYASEATLIKFLDALYKKGLFQESTSLGAHFGIDLELDKTFVQLRTNKDNLAKLACGASILITILIIGFTCLVPFLRKGGNKFIGCPLTSMINEELLNTTTQWAKNIVSANVSEIYNILHHCEVSNKTSQLLFDAVDLAFYGDMNNFLAVFQFVRGIFSPWYKYDGYSSLIASMSLSGYGDTLEKMKLLYFIKLAMDKEKIGSDLYAKYKKLTEYGHSAMNDIILRQCVTIENINYLEHLFVSDVVNTQKQPLIMTTKWKTDESGRVQFAKAFWNFVAGYENEQLFFKIEHFHYPNNFLMCPGSELFDNHSRKTVGCAEDVQININWAVEPSNDGWELFTIKRMNGCVLYSPGYSGLYNKTYRHVFTREGDCNVAMANPNITYWDIRKCPPTS